MARETHAEETVPTNERVGCCSEPHAILHRSAQPVQALRVLDKEASSLQDWSPCLMPIHANTFSFHSQTHTHKHTLTRVLCKNPTSSISKGLLH